MARKKNDENQGRRYVMLPFVGVHDFRTGKTYNHKTITDEVAEYLLENHPNYKDRILTVEEYEELGRPTFSGYQRILAKEKYNEEVEEVKEPEPEVLPEDDSEPEKE